MKKWGLVFIFAIGFSFLTGNHADASMLWPWDECIEYEYQTVKKTGGLEEFWLKAEGHS